MLPAAVAICGLDIVFCDQVLSKNRGAGHSVEFRSLIAVAAKALIGDREQCEMEDSQLCTRQHTSSPQSNVMGLKQ